MWIANDRQIFGIDHIIPIDIPEYKPASSVLVGSQIIYRSSSCFIIRLENAIQRIAKERRNREIRKIGKLEKRRRREN